MPVDFTPFIVIALAVLGIMAPLCLLIAWGWRVGGGLLALEILAVTVAFLIIHVPKWKLEHRAQKGDPTAQFELSRWYAAKGFHNYDSTQWAPCFHWLALSAGQDYPPALYSLGIIYKYGNFASSPSGQLEVPAKQRQLAKGQALIDKALVLGFKPPVFNPSIPEDDFFNAVYTMPDRPISPGPQWPRQASTKVGK